MNTTSCPPREELKAYLAGWSEPEITDAIEAHLAECLSCEQTVVALEAEPNTLVEHIRSAHGYSASSDPEIDSVLSEARHLIDASTNSDWQEIPQPQLVITEIGAYELVRPLGRGGMGSVYLARHRQLGKQVAIKLLPARAFSGDHFAARFQREIRAAGELEHVAIVNATDAGQHDGTHYLVMEYIDGLDLSRIARSVGKLAIADSCAIMHSIALGLSYAHSVGIVHRDVKPSNMMLSNTGQVKILDFGLAQHNLWDETSAELTTVGQLMGTLDYMSPEQAERADTVDYRADLYSLGATLFRLLCGHAPLAVTPNLSPIAKLRLLASHKSPSLDTLRPDAPPALVKLVNSLLARDPAERPASAAYVAEGLQAFTGGADLISLIAHAQANASKLPAEPFEKVPTTPQHIAQPAIATATDTSGGGTSRWSWLTAAALAPMFLFAAVLITLELQKGQLVIESEGANVSVSLLKEGEFYQQLKIEPGANTTRLYAGKYQVEIDSGSDSLQFDNRQFTIQKGETTIARVRAEKSTIAPAPSMGDLPKSVSMPETQSIEREILELEIEAQELLAKVGQGHPSLVSVERRLKLLREFADRSEQPANSSNARTSELLFEGKSLTQWLNVLAHERSPDAISGAFVAVNALMLPENRQQVSETLLRILPTLDGEMKLNMDGSRAQLDTIAFSLLRRTTPAVEYYPMLAHECERSQDLKWMSRILESWKVAIAESAPTTFVDWLQLNIIESKERHPLLDESTKLFAIFLLFQQVTIDSSLEDRMLKALEDCQFLGNDFWLQTYFIGATDGNHKLTVPGAKFAAQVCLHAISALDEEETPARYVVQAIIVLDNFRGSLIELVGDEGLARLHAALGRRLAELASSESELYAMVELNSPFRSTEIKEPFSFPQGFTVFINYSNGSWGGSSSRYASVTVELVNFIEHMEFDERFRSELKAIYQVTVPVTQELYLLFARNDPFRSHGFNSTIRLNWPALELSENERHLFTVPPTQHQWLAAFVKRHLTRTFSDLATEAQIKELFQATKLAWTELRFKQFDSDMDNQLSVNEFAELVNELKWPMNFSLADKNEAGSVSVDELFEYLESGAPMVAKFVSPATSSSGTSNDQQEYSKRQIVKYDLNGDGALTANEWELMIIKPIGADANSDGVITVEEYANFRTKR